MHFSLTAALCGLVGLTSVFATPVARQASTNSFLVDSITTQNGRVGDVFQAKIAGLLLNNSPVEYSISSSKGGDWVKISPEGILSGTPGRKAKETRVTVKATAADKTTSQLKVTIPVVASGNPLVKKFNALSYNMWYGGTKMNNFHTKQITFLASANLDIVVLQEASRDDATRLGQALGWYHFQGDSSAVGVISRYPIVEEYAQHGHGVAVRVALDGEENQINVWGVHLNSSPYGPYDFCFENMTIPQVLQREEDSKRGPQVRESLSLMKDHLENTDDVPVILLGDFNSPSHLDWTDKNQHCGVGAVPWPASTVPTDAGMIDSYREANPNPRRDPGITWSPIYLENNDRPEPMDRIDYIYHKGDLKVTHAETLAPGNPTPMPNHQDNYWTSDHSAVLARFDLREY